MRNEPLFWGLPLGMPLDASGAAVPKKKLFDLAHEPIAPQRYRPCLSVLRPCVSVLKPFEPLRDIPLEQNRAGTHCASMPRTVH